MLPPSNRLQWQFVDSVLTDRNGRLNYSIPGEKVSEKGVYALKYLVKLAYQLCICVSTIRFLLLPPSPSPHRGDHTTADCNMFALPAATEAILFSFDGALAAKFSLGARDIQIRSEAVEVVRWDLLHTGDGQGTGGGHALVGAMLLWGPCYCGGHAIVGAMLLWGPCYCGGHVIVGTMLLWGPCYCGGHVIGGGHVIVGTMLLWGPCYWWGPCYCGDHVIVGSCYCGGHAIVGAMLLWGPCYCGRHGPVRGHAWRHVALDIQSV